MPQEELQQLLKLLGGMQQGGIGMDCSIVPSKKVPDVHLVSTTDFFYPLVDDPYIQGQISCSNVLSDIYSLGISECDAMLMILAMSRDMPRDDAHIVTQQMIKGFNDKAAEAGTEVTGGQTVLNPWPIIGGVAKAVLRESDFIRPENAEAGDVIVLTKPIGTQPAVNVNEWLYDEEKSRDVLQHITRAGAAEAYDTASTQMCRLNRTVAKLMHKYGAKACTDVTGFGIRGHMENLSKEQLKDVSLRVDKIPVIKGMLTVGDKYPFFKLREGYSAETSGGLCVILPKDTAVDFCQEIEETDGHPAWLIGEVTEGGGNIVDWSNVEMFES